MRIQPPATLIASDHDDHPWRLLAEEIKQWAKELGFQQCGITNTDPGEHVDHLEEWLAQGFHGEMEWMRDHQAQRNNPRLLLEQAGRVISVRMNYLPENTRQISILKDPDKAYISRYALGRDYHKLIRKRLAKLGKRIAEYCESQRLLIDINGLQQRPFVDSAPVLEKAYGEKAGLGWIGKNTLLLDEQAGSWFFLGEIITNLPLPIDETQKDNRCGSCEACLKICPTDAFVAPYKLDASRCISYLTIELKGPIPLEFRGPMGNRVFGCDDCQLVCPWNKFAKPSTEKDFSPRHQLNEQQLIDLFMWTEPEYLTRTEGSPIRRIGYERWLRNLAVGLGNAAPSAQAKHALQQRQDFDSAIVKEHIQWALEQQHSLKKRQRKIRRPRS